MKRRRRFNQSLSLAERPRRFADQPDTGRSDCLWAMSGTRNVADIVVTGVPLLDPFSGV